MTRDSLRCACTAMLALLAISTVPGCPPGAATAPDNSFQDSVDARTALRRAAEDKEAETRSHALEALAEVSPGRSGPVFLQALDDGDPAARFAAAMAIGQTKYAPARDKLVAMAKDKELEPDRRVLCAVVYALDQLDDKSFNYALGELLFDPEWQVRANAAMVMGKMGEPTAAGPLKTLLVEEQNEAVLLQIHEALAILGDSRSRYFLETYIKGYGLDLRLAAVPALAKTDTDRARYVLRGLLDHDKSPRIRVVSAGWLARLGQVEESGYQLCLRALADPEGMLRAAYSGAREVQQIEARSLQRLAAMALAEMNRPEAIGALRPLLNSSDGGVRVAAAMAIMKLVGPDVEQIEAPEIEAEQTAEPQPPPPKVKLHTAGGKD